MDRAGREIRALNPKLIRLLIQEYYDFLPAFNQCNWKKIGASADMVPVMSRCIHGPLRLTAAKMRALTNRDAYGITY